MKTLDFQPNVQNGNAELLYGAAQEARDAYNVAAAEPVTAELVNYRADGTPFWNRVRVSPVRGARETTRYLRFQTDVTERKRTDKLVRLLNRVLRHNLRNEMNVVLGAANHLCEGDGADDAVEAATGPGVDENEVAVVARGEERPLEHGSGLGLWLVNWVVTRYGGSCQVETGDAGTTVTLRLPALDTDTSVETAARPPTVLSR